MAESQDLNAKDLLRNGMEVKEGSLKSRGCMHSFLFVHALDADVNPIVSVNAASWIAFPIEQTNNLARTIAIKK